MMLVPPPPRRRPRRWRPDPGGVGPLLALVLSLALWGLATWVVVVVT